MHWMSKGKSGPCSPAFFYLDLAKKFPNKNGTMFPGLSSSEGARVAVKSGSMYQINRSRKKRGRYVVFGVSNTMDIVLGIGSDHGPRSSCFVSNMFMPEKSKKKLLGCVVSVQTVQIVVQLDPKPRCGFIGLYRSKPGPYI